jgi:GNAT superfamily N-acetyltransferase
MRLSFRDVVDSDQPFLLALYASTRELELSQVPWSDEQKRIFVESQFAAQSRSYPASYPAATHQVICADELPVGRLYLNRGATTFHILDITIAPGARNAGIGTAVLHGILEEAAQARKPVSIYTETFNPSMRLFERLGFRTVSVDGFLVLLERPTPEAAGQPAG